MSNSDLGQSDAPELSDDIRREISEFVDQSEHYSSVEEFIEDAARYQIEFFQRTTDAAQQPIDQTNSVVLRVLTAVDHAIAELHEALISIIRQYVSLISQSENQYTQPQPRSRTTAAEKMELYNQNSHSDTVNRTYQQRTAEMRSLLEQKDLSSAEIEQGIRESEDK